MKGDSVRKFMLIFHQSPAGGFDGLPPQERQRVVEKYMAWKKRIESRGRYVTSDKLAEEGGKVVTLKQGQVSVTDGPYVEAKEVVGGYFTIRAETYEEAVGLVRD